MRTVATSTGKLIAAFTIHTDVEAKGAIAQADSAWRSGGDACIQLRQEVL
jgi:hypothetical protein